MSLANLVRLNVYTTDVDRLFEHYGELASRLGAVRVAPTSTMLGVTRLAVPDLMVELEGTAVAGRRPAGRSWPTRSAPVVRVAPARLLTPWITGGHVTRRPDVLRDSDRQL